MINYYVYYIDHSLYCLYWHIFEPHMGDTTVRIFMYTYFLDLIFDNRWIVDLKSE